MRLLKKPMSILLIDQPSFSCPQPKIYAENGLTLFYNQKIN